MKKVDFEYFAPGQYIYYDVGRIIQIENLLKKGIGEIAGEQALNMSSLCVMLTVGLRHHGFKSPDTIAPLLQKAMDNLKDDLKQSGAGSVGATPNVTDEKEKETKKHAEKVKSFSDRLKSDKRRG